MESPDLASSLREYLPLAITAALVAAMLGTGHAWLRWHGRRRANRALLAPQLVMLALTALGVVVIVVALPASEAIRTQLLALLGLVIAAVLAFASTTFAANAMAGLMLRAVRNFSIGDWIRVGEFFGRVTEHGLFHVEIQTEDRDLATLPNFFIATNPVTVVRSSGTIISATLSLGYDRDHRDIEPLLLRAAETSGLEDSFVQIVDLDDFSVRYRIGGFLPEVKQLITARSSLRSCVLDALHGAGVEIVSPAYMNQRRVPEDTPVIPKRRVGRRETVAATPMEEIAFDKAEESAAAKETERDES